MILCTSESLLDENIKKIEFETKTKVIQKKISFLSEIEKYQIQCILTYGNYDDLITAEDLEQLPNVKWIQSMSSGTEQLPYEIIAKKNICVTSAKGVHAIPISEYVMATMLYFAKKIEKFQSLKKSTTWDISIEMFELYEKNLGVLGTGHIGQEIANKARHFGMNVLGMNRTGYEVEGFQKVYSLNQITDMLPHCDYICSVLPSNVDTRDLINRKTINLMKDGVIFINVGRGDLVVEEDIVDALQTRKISGAALDVFRDEPLESAHPLWFMDNVIITPHASAQTNMFINRFLGIFLHNYFHFRSGDFSKMINRINS